ncbi:hypothetical protein BKA93DRAFT_519458 [Sparassis latifolia]
MLLASIITSIIVTVQTFSIPDGWWYIPTPAPPEVPISSVFLTYLARAKPSIISSRFRRVMKRLTILVWEAAIPPCVCAIVTVILYSTQVCTSFRTTCPLSLASVTAMHSRAIMRLHCSLPATISGLIYRMTHPP